MGREWGGFSGAPLVTLAFENGGALVLGAVGWFLTSGGSSASLNAGKGCYKGLTPLGWVGSGLLFLSWSFLWSPHPLLLAGFCALSRKVVALSAQHTLVCARSMTWYGRTPGSGGIEGCHHGGVLLQFLP
jgi:hypothetical protein